MKKKYAPELEYELEFQLMWNTNLYIRNERAHCVDPRSWAHFATK